MQNAEPDGVNTIGMTPSGKPIAASSHGMPPMTDQRALTAPAPLAKPTRRLRRVVLMAGLLIILCAGGGGWYWWKHRPMSIPDGIVWGNGRVEADEINITPKYAGRVATLLVDEGDLVKPGEVVARMDTRDTEATLQKSVAQMRLMEHALEEASANLIQQKTQQKLAQQQFDRTKALLQKGYATIELLDQRQQTLDGANAAVSAAIARIAETEQAIAAATHDVAYYKIVIEDSILVAPRTARVQYRLVNTGEVIGAGTKIFTLLDLSNIYMTAFLPTEDAGKISLGSEGRIVLDALPALVLPGHVSFVSTASQFTPKMVETRSERDKLMFRVKVRIEPDLVARHLSEVRTGLPGVAYVRFDPNLAWPRQLQVNVPP